MHYPYNAFSKSFRKRTIIPLRPNIDKPYKKLSHFDILQANMMYRCPNERQTNNNERQTGNKEQEVEGLFIVVGVFVHGVLSAVCYNSRKMFRVLGFLWY